ncbi:MAG: hypothetical protein K8I30_07795, partial [Anaerolineae bacterium]|nr:hypothetical protein [Anaerolineae bacterium]
MTAPTTAGRSRVRRQLRDFVLIWTGITVVMGACTFIAIYAAYGALTQNTPGSSRNNLALPIATSSPQAAAVNATAIPTRAVVQPATPTPLPPTEETVAEVNAAPTEPPTSAPPTATLLPIQDKRYQV